MKPSFHFASWAILLLLAFAHINTAAAQPPKPKDGPLGMKFVPLPKGSFYMGWNSANDRRGGVFRQTQRMGTVKKTEIKEDFEIAIHTVTQGQWQELMGNNPSYFSRKGGGQEKIKDIVDEELQNFPVEQVSWEDVQDFLKKLNETEVGKGYVYRLPTEPEWEYACRGGATTEKECSYDFYFAKPTNELSLKMANFNARGEDGSPLGRTTKVGSYAPNKLGLYDMHGNVWEWTYTPRGVSRKGQGGRGGCWFSASRFCRAGYRFKFSPMRQYGYMGLRLVRLPVRSSPN